MAAMSSDQRPCFRSPWRWLGLTLLLATMAASCSGGESDSVLLVFAAASLSEAFAELEVEFESRHPDVDVRLNHAGSSALREQIRAGAPADVFVSADPSHMDLLLAAGYVSEAPDRLVGNRMAIGVPVGNPGAVMGLSDLADGGLEIGLCAATVPCGRLARSVLEEAGVVPALDTEEPDVRALVTKLGADELDAGIVYVSDVVSGAGVIDGIEIPEEFNVLTEYPVATLGDAPNAARAAEFVEFTLSPVGQETLSRYGFEVS